MSRKAFRSLSNLCFDISQERIDGNCIWPSLPMTDDNGVFVYNAAQLISCCVQIMCSALDILYRQSGKAGVQVAVQSKG